MKLIVKNIKIATAFLAFLIVANVSGFAQCSSVVKEGISKLAPFTFNGQINNASIKEGVPAELHLAFYKGYYYKIQVAFEPVFVGSVSFRVLTENKVEVFNSLTDGPVDNWVFYSNSAQDLIIEVISTEKSKKHCVAVLVGIQVPKNNNPMRYL